MCNAGRMRDRLRVSDMLHAAMPVPTVRANPRQGWNGFALGGRKTGARTAGIDSVATSGSWPHRSGQVTANRPDLWPVPASLGLTGGTVIEDLIQIVYSSEPFGYDGAMLNGILLDARTSNTRDGITGALVCRRDIYLQLLEGPERQVKAAFERISRDDRHLSIRKLVSRRISARTFGNWAMLHDPEKSWIWSEEDLSRGILDRASEAEIGQVFTDLAERIGDGSPE